MNSIELSTLLPASHHRSGCLKRHGRIHRVQIIPFLLVMLVLTSCGTLRNQYSKDALEWINNSPDSSMVLKHTMYLIGDAGNASGNEATPVLTFLNKQLASETENSSVLFLGDNIYAYGMPPSGDGAKREIAEQRIMAQLKVVDNYRGRPVFIPGNHDWRGWGQKGLQRQEEFVESYLNKQRGIDDKDEWENYFLPDDGCAGPQVVELNDRVVVIVVDSQWWLGDTDKNQKTNSDCAARNKASFKFVFENTVRKYKNHNVVIAMHHPLYTYGPHGGVFTAKDHLFPLAEVNPKLMIPLPGIGSVVAFFRAAIGSRQDVAHPDYRALRAAMLAGVKKNGNFIFASGHEHALQYIENGGQKFVVSGSASKTSPVTLGKGSLFASGAMGFSVLKFYECGEAWVEYWQVAADATTAGIIFRQRIKDKNCGELQPTDYSEYEQHSDSTYRYVTDNPTEPAGKAHAFLLGEHHRNLYMEKYSFPVLDLEVFHGGVTPVKLGGGNQTNSLRVRDSKGRDYVLRGMTKDATRFLPHPFNKMTAAKYLVEDNFLSTHPFAPLAVPHLADAINVYHANPKLYYVPGQPRLGEYNSTIGGSIYLVEERPSGKNWRNAEFFGSPKNIISTPEMIDNILSSNRNTVDGDWTLRTRLLDFLIGDWDRHDDQWTWACFDGPDDMKYFRPIPRDRDQAFSKYDGLITQVARQTQPFLRQLQSYGPDIKSVKWTSWSARLVDQTFLTELSWDEWEKQVRFIQQALTDEKIRNSFVDWPKKAREISEEDVIRSITSRRDNLMEVAREYYVFLNESVDIVGTKDKEIFLVERIDQAHTRVTVLDGSGKGKSERVIFQRTFDHQITKSITLYGNGNDDTFNVSGDVRRGITVRLVGGAGHDEFNDSSSVMVGKKKTIIHDDLRKNNVTGSEEVLDKRSNVSRYNVYDRRGYESNYDMVIPYPYMAFNPDDAFLLGANFSVVRHGFKKAPYASSQQIGGSYAFGTRAFKFNYQADFSEVFKSWDLYLEARYHGPGYAFNFAGLGNNSTRPVDDPDYYRVRQSMIYLYPALKKTFSGNGGYFTVGPSLEIARIEDTPGRFISDYGTEGNRNLFDRQYFAGVKVGFHYSNVDNNFAPHEGIRFNTDISWNNNLKNGDNYTAWRVQLECYQHLDRNENVVLATQLGWSRDVGTGYNFYQMPTLGGNNGLRAYRTERFYGDASFWQSSDIRFRLINSKNHVLPFTLGVFGGFDYGRVWLEGESSNHWHTSYGGGIWMAPVDVLTISIGSFVPNEASEESPRFTFNVGFAF